MEGRYIDAGGIRTYCLDRGKGPVVVLLHGAALAVDSHTTWFRTIPDLERDHRVVAFDQVGFGRTAMPPDGVYRNRLERVDHALAVLEALGIEKACLVGHSEGGFIAARMAIVEPSLASHLVIVTSGGTAPYLGQGRDAQWIAVAEATYNDRRQFESEDAFIRIQARLSHSRDDAYEALLRESYRRGKKTGHMKLFADMPPSDANYAERERLQRDYVLPYLKDLKIPVLLIWALNDAGVVVERGVKLLERIPGGELHVFSGASHNVMHDCWDGFNRLLRDWRRRPHLRSR
jgi:pimeloyl-ACP methyl ester carboxylesterase